MRQKQKLNVLLFSRIGAIFLLLIFLGTPVIEVFHHHGKSSISKCTGGKHYSSPEKKCNLCNLIKHQSPDFYIPQQHVSALMIQPVQKQQWYFLLQSSSCFILKCANKGPPVFCADLAIS
jgi:hypothetical protein